MICRILSRQKRMSLALLVRLKREAALLANRVAKVQDVDKFFNEA